MSRDSRQRIGKDVFSRETRAQIASKQMDEHNGEPLSITAKMSVEALKFLDNLRDLLARGDGWMRWTSDLDGKTVYLKYKFNSTTWPNHYVFTSGPVYDIAEQLEVLMGKLEDVDRGYLRPTADKPFNHM